jgi:hypothetical protein
MHRFVAVPSFVPQVFQQLDAVADAVEVVQHATFRQCVARQQPVVVVIVRHQYRDRSRLPAHTWSSNSNDCRVRDSVTMNVLPTSGVLIAVRLPP